MKSFLQKNNTEIHSMHDKGKFVVAESFTRTLMIKLYKCMTSMSKNAYINKLYYIVNKYNNTNQRNQLMFNQTYTLTLAKHLMTKILNLKLVILLEY